MSESLLEIRNLTKNFGSVTALNNISLDIKTNEMFALLGPSGCGKTTLLRIIAGFEYPDSGQILMNQADLLAIPTRTRPVNLMFQSYALFPHMDVFSNISYGLTNTSLSKEEISKQTFEIIEKIGLQEHVKKKPNQLSGGQQQRVALARVLALEPEVILLDEPFSQIDAFRKNALRRNLFRYLKQKGITCIIATHDSTDALSFADEAIVMRNGEVIIKDNPTKIYEDPETKYVASLFGEVNEVPTHLLVPYEDQMHKTLVYPHQFKMVTESNLPVKIRRTYFRGNHYLIETVYKRQLIFFESEIDLPLEQEIFLGLNYL